MCDIVGAISAASVVANAVGQARTARATERAAVAGMQDQYAMLTEQRFQQRAAATDQMTERSQRAMREVGTLNAIFADSGLDGASHDRLLAESSAAAAADVTTIRRNSANAMNQSAFEGSAIQSRTQSTINSAPRPSLLGTGLQIAGVAADARARAAARR